MDTPLKVARFGISSVMSIIDDALLERLREHHLGTAGLPYEPIPDRADDARARRITAYLDMVQDLVATQIGDMKRAGFVTGAELHTYFDLLPEDSPLKALYRRMAGTADAGERARIEARLLERVVRGSIDVNIMTKVDKTNYARNGAALPVEQNDAHAALRGFALSRLIGSVIFSAGMNPRLYAYASTFDVFHPGADGRFAKRIVIKVSDFRSALIQGKFLAKKGLWVSEYRIESGLNCGGHAFATDGLLLGPILEEFRARRGELHESVGALLAPALEARGVTVDPSGLALQITVQGGVGTAHEQAFLRRHYGLNSIGWGSPFLLVPEAVNVDEDTLERLSRAREEDLYLSEISPLGVPFNNLRDNAKDLEKLRNAEAGRPGSACKRKFLSFNTEFTTTPICTASTSYINHKVQELRDLLPSASDLKNAYDRLVAKACLCEGLVASALSRHGLSLYKQSTSASVCPGPNIAYFSKRATLREMVDHIYGRGDLVTEARRPHMFLKELSLYIDYFQKKHDEHVREGSSHTEAFFLTFHESLMEGIEYYKRLIPEIREETENMRERMRTELAMLEERLRMVMAAPAGAA